MVILLGLALYALLAVAAGLFAQQVLKGRRPQSHDFRTGVLITLLPIGGLGLFAVTPWPGVWLVAGVLFLPLAAAWINVEWAGQARLASGMMVGLALGFLVMFTSCFAYLQIQQPSGGVEPPPTPQSRWFNHVAAPPGMLP